MNASYYLMVLLAIFFTQCRYDTENISPDPLFPSYKTFKTPIFIEVFTTDGSRVPDAKVSLGRETGYTDTQGLLFWSRVTVGESAYLTVEKEGYFMASRRFYPSADKAEYIKIILLPDHRIAFFTSSNGSTISLEAGFTLQFPPDIYVTKSGKPFQGVVVVSAVPIAADDPDLSFKMPGDLLGLTASGALGKLASLGMIAIALKSGDGEELQLKKDATVQLQIKLPDNLANQAPQVIPLWYFDETDGVWEEEGLAVLNGDTYHASIPHFSFWNCDAWFELVRFEASFVYEDSTPASHVFVCITVDALKTTTCAHTDAAGQVRGMVAADEVLTLQMKDRCVHPLHTVTIGPLTDDIVYGPVIVLGQNQRIQVSGYAVDCQYNGLEKGYVRFNDGINVHYTIPDPVSGFFKISFRSCLSSNIVVSVVDHESLAVSELYEFAPLAEVYTDTLRTCQDLDEFAIINVEGVPRVFVFRSLGFTLAEDYYSIIFSDDSTNTEESFYLMIEGKAAGNYHNAEAHLYLKLDSDSGVQGFDANIQITQYGNVGEYVKGNFQGILYGGQQMGGPSYAYSGSFSVLRE